MSVEYRLAELERKFENLIRIATVSDLDAERSFVKVTDGELQTGWLPWLTGRAAGNDISYDPPLPGERVALFCPSGDPANGFVVPALYCQTSPSPETNPAKTVRRYSDGAVLSYDRSGHHWKLVLPEGGRFSVQNSESEISLSEAEIKVRVGQTEVLVSDGVIKLLADSVESGNGTLMPVARKGDQVDPNTHKILGGSDVHKSA